MTAYERVLAARAKGRPTAMDFIESMISGFVELHGDRRFSDDGAIVTGLGYLNHRCVTVIGLEKGHDTAEKVRRNFGSAQPEGYRKALRHMRLAEKFHRPVICLVDTAGAACGLGAEERGQGLAIAENLMEMMGLTVPVLSIIIGEGGSGGALALAAANQVWMLENAVYSVLSPEGAASIIWKDAKRTKEASESLKLTAEDMLSFGVIEKIIPEDQGKEKMLSDIKAALIVTLEEYCQKSGQEIRDQRYERFRKMGGMRP